MKPNDNFADGVERTSMEMHGNGIWEYREWHCGHMASGKLCMEMNDENKAEDTQLFFGTYFQALMH